MREKSGNNKCVCGAMLRKIKTEMELFGGDVMVKNVDAFWCPSCKEELMDSGQIGAAKEKVREIVPHFEVYKSAFFKNGVFGFGQYNARQDASINYFLPCAPGTGINLENHARLFIF